MGFRRHYLAIRLHLTQNDPRWLRGGTSAPRRECVYHILYWDQVFKQEYPTISPGLTPPKVQSPSLPPAKNLDLGMPAACSRDSAVSKEDLIDAKDGAASSRKPQLMETERFWLPTFSLNLVFRKVCKPRKKWDREGINSCRARAAGRWASRQENAAYQTAVSECWQAGSVSGFLGCRVHESKPAGFARWFHPQNALGFAVPVPAWGSLPLQLPTLETPGQ